MLTETQRKAFVSSLKEYRKRYLLKKYSELDESDTRLMINYFLTDVLGYKELEEIKTEYAIKGRYADYVIQLDKNQHIIVEVKAIQIDLSEKHIRQALDYAANEGINWVLLTNGRQYNLYRVIFSKPMKNKLIFSFDLNDINELKISFESFEYLTRKCVAKGDLERFWKRFQAGEPKNLCKYFYKPEVVKFLKRSLKKEANLNFSEEDIFDAIHFIITNKIDYKQPRFYRKTSK